LCSNYWKVLGKNQLSEFSTSEGEFSLPDKIGAPIYELNQALSKRQEITTHANCHPDLFIKAGNNTLANSKHSTF